MYLHFPRSDLVTALPAPRAVIHERFLLPTSSQHLHAHKAISAAKEQGNLASYPPSLRKYSPFFTCAVVFSIILQISPYAAHRPGSHDRHWEQVTLIAGVLKTLGNTWEVARVTPRKIRRIIAGVFRADAQSSCVGPQGWRASGVGVSVASTELELPWIDMLYWTDYELV
ncbi:hypothetical protein BBP40_006580 [Aspergillus hancockii]|nr:hypothetical protein BBP40_006580 [Aspergillus hancockii]